MEEKKEEIKAEQSKNENATEELKNETVKAVNEVKETFKNVDIKNDAKATKGFIGSMFKDPFETIKEIANDKTNKHFKIAIILVVIWMAIKLIAQIFAGRYTTLLGRFSFDIAFKQILSIIKVVIAPALSIIVLSLIVYLFNKQNKKSIPTTITAIVTAKVPVIIASAVSLLTIISTEISKITGIFSSFCSTISIVLTFFAMKNLLGEEKCSTFFKKFILIEAIFYIAYFVVSFLGIYL